MNVGEVRPDAYWRQRSIFNRQDAKFAKEGKGNRDRHWL